MPGFNPLARPVTAADFTGTPEPEPDVAELIKLILAGQMRSPTQSRIENQRRQAERLRGYGEGPGEWGAVPGGTVVRGGPMTTLSNIGQSVMADKMQAGAQTAEEEAARKQQDELNRIIQMLLRSGAQTFSL